MYDRRKRRYIELHRYRALKELVVKGELPADHLAKHRLAKAESEGKNLEEMLGEESFKKNIDSTRGLIDRWSKAE